MPIHRYQVIRACFWADRFWKDDETATVDTDTAGPPPYHFKPLDGGPLMEQKRYLYEGENKQSKIELSNEPQTFAGAQQAMSNAKPLGAPSDRTFQQEQSHPMAKQPIQGITQEPAEDPSPNPFVRGKKK